MGSMIAINEMNRRAEEIIFKVRSELFRSGSAPDNFSVERQGPFLRMTFANQTICTDPYEVWIVLRKMAAGLDDAEIWARVSSVRRVKTPDTPVITWGTGLIVVGLLILLILLVRVDRL